MSGTIPAAILSTTANARTAMPNLIACEAET
jgi:hypothetical protein